MTSQSPLARLGAPNRVWAVAVCNGDVARLERMHLAVAEHFRLGDRLVYLGNYLGTPQTIGIIDCLLDFRIQLLARPGMAPGDFVYLRGVQEEIWSKLLQIQFAPNPHEVLRWMLDHGADATAECYGADIRAGLSATREGASAMARWTSRIRDAVRSRPGHDKFLSVLQRAALSDDAGAGGVLFVHAGYNPDVALQDQADAFWWDAAGFERIERPIAGLGRLVRGSDPNRRGRSFDRYTVTLDSGCGRGGSLIAAGFDAGGQIVKLFEA